VKEKLVSLACVFFVQCKAALRRYKNFERSEPEFQTFASARSICCVALINLSDFLKGVGGAVVPSAGRLHPLPPCLGCDAPEQNERHGGRGCSARSPTRASFAKCGAADGTEAICAVTLPDEVLGSVSKFVRSLILSLRSFGFVDTYLLFQ